MSTNYWAVFAELIRTPFEDISLFWGIGPLYFGLFLNELTSAKANFRTAIQTGFSFLWAGAQWLYFYSRAHRVATPPPNWRGTQSVNLFVTCFVLALGLMALVSGLRRRYPKYFSFLGYTRFSNYFMITIFPMQAHALGWTWDRLAAIALFAVPIWLLLHFGLKPFRK